MVRNLISLNYSNSMEYYIFIFGFMGLICIGLLIIGILIIVYGMNKRK